MQTQVCMSVIPLTKIADLKAAAGISIETNLTSGRDHALKVLQE